MKGKKKEKKKGATIILLIALIFIGVVLGYNMSKSDDNKEQNKTNTTNSISKNEVEENKTKTNTSVENTVENDKEEKNEVEENITTENKIEDEKEKEKNKEKENASNNNNSKDSSSTSSKEKDPEKIAIDLAKEKWGNMNNNVYFDVEEKNESKGIYTIVVRDNSTTVEMITYKVDINKKTVTEE